MSTQNIIELAREAQQENLTDASGYWFQMEVRDLERFAALIRVQALEEAAGVCENTLAQHYMKQVILTHDEALLLAACADCATAIRALKEKP